MSALGTWLGLGFLPAAWRIPAFAALGVTLGSGLMLAEVARVTSYLSDDPETCVNCHVMYPQYTTWQHSAHARVATCNDCHVPHTNVFATYAFKAMDGLKHSAVFTARAEPQVIRISNMAVPVVEQNCRRCHEQLVAATHPQPYHHGERLCWDCHRDVPHGRERSLSITPRIMTPALPAIGSSEGSTIGGRSVRPKTE